LESCRLPRFLDLDLLVVLDQFGVDLQTFEQRGGHFSEVRLDNFLVRLELLGLGDFDHRVSRLGSLVGEGVEHLGQIEILRRFRFLSDALELLGELARDERDLGEALDRVGGVEVRDFGRVSRSIRLLVSASRVLMRSVGSTDSWAALRA
jgi:hypothetical protein